MIEITPITGIFFTCKSCSGPGRVKISLIPEASRTVRINSFALCEKCADKVVKSFKALGIGQVKVSDEK